MSRIDEVNRNHTKEEMYELGLEFRDGMNGEDTDSKCCVVQMPTTAIKYFTKAAERGHVLAQYELAVMYEKGIGSEVDIEKAIEWYTAAALHDHEEAKMALVRLSNEN